MNQFALIVAGILSLIASAAQAHVIKVCTQKSASAKAGHYYKVISTYRLPASDGSSTVWDGKPMSRFLVSEGFDVVANNGGCAEINIPVNASAQLSFLIIKPDHSVSVPLIPSVLRKTEKGASLSRTCVHPRAERTSYRHYPELFANHCPPGMLPVNFHFTIENKHKTLVDLTIPSIRSRDGLIYERKVLNELHLLEIGKRAGSEPESVAWRQVREIHKFRDTVFREIEMEMQQRGLKPFDAAGKINASDFYRTAKSMGLFAVEHKAYEQGAGSPDDHVPIKNFDHELFR